MNASKKCYCKVYTLPCKGDFNIKYSNTVKGNKPVWKITGKTFISSIEETETAKDDVRNIMSELKQKITRTISTTPFDSNFIFDYDFIKYVDTSFKNKMVSFDLFLKQKEKGDVKEELMNLLDEPINELTSKFMKTNLKPTNARQ